MCTLSNFTRIVSSCPSKEVRSNRGARHGQDPQQVFNSVLSVIAAAKSYLNRNANKLTNAVALGLNLEASAGELLKVVRGDTLAT